MKNAMVFFWDRRGLNKILRTQIERWAHTVTFLYKKDLNKLEEVQRRATKIVQGSETGALGLWWEADRTSLGKRRPHEDPTAAPQYLQGGYKKTEPSYSQQCMVWVYKQMHKVKEERLGLEEASITHTNTSSWGK